MTDHLLHSSRRLRAVRHRTLKGRPMVLLLPFEALVERRREESRESDRRRVVGIATRNEADSRVSMK